MLARVCQSSPHAEGDGPSSAADAMGEKGATDVTGDPDEPPPRKGWWGTSGRWGPPPAHAEEASAERGPRVRGPWFRGGVLLAADGFLPAGHAVGAVLRARHPPGVRGARAGAIRPAQGEAVVAAAVRPGTRRAGRVGRVLRRARRRRQLDDVLAYLAGALHFARPSC